MNAPSAAALWAALREQGLAEGEVPAPPDASTLWYLRVLTGVGGWISAVFLFVFLAFAGVSVIGDSHFTGICLGLGGLTCGAAFALFRVRHYGEFAAQFGIAVAVAGQVLVLIGLFDLFDHGGRAAYYFGAFLFELAMVWVLRNFLSRLLSSWAAMGLLALGLEGFGFGELGVLLAASGCAALTVAEARLARHTALCRPLAAGLAMALLYLGVGWTFNLTPHVSFEYDYEHVAYLQFLVGFLARGFAGAVLVATVLALLRREGIGIASAAGAAALCGALLMAMVAFRSASFGYGMLILLLGFASGQRVLMGLGLSACLLFVSNYYYRLDYTLLEKSAQLAVVGALLLMARWAMRHYLWGRASVEA